MKTHIITLILLTCSLNLSYSQCTVTIMSNNVAVDTLQICGGDFIDLKAVTNCNFLSMYDDFNNAGMGPGWDSYSIPMFNNPCPPLLPPASGIVCWIGSTSNFPRHLTTIPFNIVYGTVEFDMKYGDIQTAQDCEDPDQANEGVHLQFSTNGGATWTDINYWEPITNMTGPLYTWNHYTETIPFTALSPNTQFRWYQDLTSGVEWDHWGVDNVEIIGDLVVSWSTGHTQLNPPPMYPTQTGYISCSIFNTQTGYSASDSVYIIVGPTVTAYNVTGGGFFCYGNAGLPIGLDGSQANINYELFRNGSSQGITKVGTGAPIDFGLLTTGGTYTVTGGDVNATCFNQMTGSVSILVYSSPITNAGSDQTINSGTATMLDGSAISGSPPYSWYWSPPTMVSNPLIENPITVNLLTTQLYTLVVTDAKGCTGSDDITITIGSGILTANPTANPETICIGGTSTLHANAGGGSGVYTYSWASNPSGFTSTQKNPIVTPSVTTTYTVTVDDGLNSTNANTTITVIYLPTVNAGTDATICEDVTYTLSGSGTLYSSALWSTAGDGIFNDNTLINATYSPGLVDIVNGSVNLTLTLNGATPCGSNSDDMNLTIIQNPMAYAGIDDAVCEYDSYALSGIANNYSSLLWIGGDGTFTDNTIPNPVYTPGSIDILSGSVTLSLTAFGVSLCGDTIDSMILSINPLPVVEFSGQSPVCANSASFVLSGGNPGGGTYSGTGIVSNMFNPSSAGTGTHILTYSFTDTFGCSGIDTTIIIVHPLPIVVLSPFSDICSNDPPFTLNGGTPTGGVYTGIGVGGSSYDPAIAGIGTHILTYTFTNTNGCHDIDTTTITVIPLPTVFNVTGGGSYCSGDVGLSIGLDGSQINNNYQLFLDSSPTGISTSGTGTSIVFGLHTNAGTYTVVATNINAGCINNMAGSVNITINPLPIANAGSDQTISLGNFTTLNGAASGGTLPYSWNWSPPGSLVDPLIEDPVTSILITTQLFTLDVTDANGCNASDDVIVVVPGSILVTNPTATPDILCEGGTSQLQTNPIGGLGTYSYSWVSNPPGFTSTQKNPMVSPLVTTTYTVTLDDGLNTTSGTVTITVIHLPSADAGPDATICEDDTYTVMGTATNQSSVMWTSSGDGAFDDATMLGATYTPGLNDIASGSVVLILTSSAIQPCGSAAISTMTLDIQLLPLANAGSNAAICEDDTYTLIGTATNQSSILWTTAGDGVFDDATIFGPVYTPGPNDIANGTVDLTLTATGTQPCGSDASSNMTLTLYPGPNAYAGQDGSICKGDCINLTASGLGAYLWSNAETNASILVCPTSTTTYSVTVTGANGCTDSDDVIVKVDPLPIVDLGVDTTICLNIPLILNAGNPGVHYIWSTLETTQSITVSSTTVNTITYSVTVTDNNGCNGTGAIMVIFKDCSSIKDLASAPLINIFPNPTSGKLKIQISKLKNDIEMQIVNIHGQKILEEKLKINSSLYQKEIDFSIWPKGIYFITFRSEKYLRTEKIVVQ